MIFLAKNNEKEKALDNAVKRIEKQFGQGSIMRLGDRTSLDIESIPTGALPLDIALGVGGIPKGRIIELYGNESSGKTTLGLHIIAEAQKQGGIAAFIDAEHALDPRYAENLGVNIDDLLISQPNNGEEALEIAEALVRSNAIDLVIIDSVAALVPKAELEGEMGDSHVGLQARLMSQAMRKLSGAISKSDAACIFINQIREKIGVMFGNPETTPGGRALKFYSSVRIELRRSQTIKDGDEIIGSHARAKVVKNKVAAPFRKAEFDIMYGTGISRTGCVLDMGEDTGIIDRAGSWYSYGDVRLGQGRENSKQFLSENEDIMEEIEHKIKVKVGLIEDEEVEEEENDKEKEA
ncbi:MAG TPA: recombinase RecA [Halanaerobiales bacterium]|nr:recombinase RecA [Halanaerobiales bacterium]